MVIVVPVLIFLIMCIIQFGLWMHASRIADAAARDGVAAARLDGAAGNTSGDAARRTLDRLADGLILGSHVSASRDADRVVAKVAGDFITELRVDRGHALDPERFDVTGSVRAVIPGIELPVTGWADGSIERFRSDG
jgi:hypothetical protein